MHVSQNGRTLIEKFESLSLTPYADIVGVWTIGYGHAMTTPAGQQIKNSIFGAAKAKQLADQFMQTNFGALICTQTQADALLETDLTYFESGVESQIGANNAEQDQFDALVSFVFNIGLGNFATTSVKKLHIANKRNVGTISMSELCKQAKAHVTPTTISLAFAEWDNAGGQFSLGLFRRRLAEIMVYSGWDATKAYLEAETFND